MVSIFDDTVYNAEDPTMFEAAYENMASTSFSSSSNELSMRIHTAVPAMHEYQISPSRSIPYGYQMSPAESPAGYPQYNNYHPVPLLMPDSRYSSTQISPSLSQRSPITPPPATPSTAQEPSIRVNNEEETLLFLTTQFGGYPASSKVAPDRKSPQQEQLRLWKECHRLPSLGGFNYVPQQMYKPHTVADIKRYIEEVRLSDPIYFEIKNPQEHGIPMREALGGRVKRLENREDTLFEGRGPSVSIRIEWPGYRSWSRQIPTKDFRSPPGPVTRSKVVKNIAKCVERFIKENADKIMDGDDESNTIWRVGPGFITIDDLVLVSLHHVSMGSWQPCIRLSRHMRSTSHLGAVPLHPSQDLTIC